MLVGLIARFRKTTYQVRVVWEDGRRCEASSPRHWRSEQIYHPQRHDVGLRKLRGYVVWLQEPPPANAVSIGLSKGWSINSRRIRHLDGFRGFYVCAASVLQTDSCRRHFKMLGFLQQVFLMPPVCQYSIMVRLTTSSSVAVLIAQFRSA